MNENSSKYAPPALSSATVSPRPTARTSPLPSVAKEEDKEEEEEKGKTKKKKKDSPG
jgi:hypothetical protein